jgi:restriction endonuclease S subunit
MSDWKDVSLDQVVRLKRGYDLPEPERRPGLYPVLGSSGISGWHDQGPVKGPGVTIGRSGASIGVATYFDGDYWPLNTTLFVEDFMGNDPRYIYYLLHGIDFAGFDSGSAQPSLNRNYIRDFPISIPSSREQQAIAAALGAMDDKIAANGALSRAARDLLRAYLRAAAGSSDSDKPELSSIVEFLNRGVPPRYTRDDAQLRVLNQKCIRDGRVSFEPSRRTLTDKVPAPKLLKVNDVLVNSTGTGTLGRVARWTKAEACTADSHLTIVRFDEAKVDPVCAGLAMLEMESEIEALGEGSTGQTELSRTQLSALRITLPSRERCAKLRPLLDLLESRSDAALAESESLAELRDTLLPKLMSGQIRVRDAEKVVEDVV